MIRAGVVVSAFVAGAATTVLALYIALRTAPGVIMADDMLEALTLVADTPLSRFQPGSVVYVKSALGPLLLEKLQLKHPSVRLMAYSERPGDDCTGRKPESAWCERDDFLKLEVLSSPAPASMLVAVGTSRTFGQVLLFRFLGRWRVIIDRTYAV
jgi:hypothetical protein